MKGHDAAADAIDFDPSKPILLLKSKGIMNNDTNRGQKNTTIVALAENCMLRDKSF
jgi:hypothetical protein